MNADLISLLLFIGYFLFLVILASPGFGLNDDGWIFSRPRKMKKGSSFFIKEDVNSHASSLKEK